MRNGCLRFGLAAAVLLSGCSAKAFGIGVSLDWKMRTVDATPSPTFEGPVTIGCHWTAAVDSWFKWKDTITWSGMFLVDGKDAGSFTVSYPPNGQIYMPPHKQDSSVNIFGADYDYGGTATNEFNGTTKRTVNLTAGSHKVGCAIALVGQTGESSDHKNNNTKEIAIEVQPVKHVTPAEWPSYKTPITGRIADRNRAPQAAVNNVVIPRPTLTIEINSPTYNASCNDPYNIASVQVHVHSDLPLKANRGWVDVSEPNKGWLSGKAELPAIGAGSTVPITVELATSVQPSSLVGYHSLLIQLQAKSSPDGPAFNGPAPQNANWVTLTFPTGYCPSARVIPPPQGGRKNTTPSARRPG